MFRKTLVARAMAIAFSSAIGTLAMTDVAVAQSNATGTVFGTVAPGSADTVTAENAGTGAKRSTQVEATGRFQITSLPPGVYTISSLKGGTPVGTTKVEVLLGQGVEAKLAGPAQLGQVVVTGRAVSTDVSTTNSSAATFTAADLDRLPLEKNLTAVALLAPSTVRADPRYAGGLSIGGGAPSENSYYIDGFPVTNPLSQLGSMELPFGAIQQVQVLTGGFGAEFGRSNGGVVNVTTKSGTNEWHGGAFYSLEPEKLRANKKDIYYPNTGDPFNAETDGTIYRIKSKDSMTTQQFGAYIGGPIIKDQLFFFVAADKTVDHYSGTGGSILSSTNAYNGWIDDQNTNKRYLARLDWNITETQHLQLSSLGDNYYTQETASGFDYATGTRDAGKSYTGDFKNQAGLTNGVGGIANMVKYTGTFFDDLNVTALYGKSRSPHKEVYSPDYGNGIPGYTFSGQGHAPGVDYGTPNPLSGLLLGAPYSKDKTESYRFDLEYTLADHTLRGGYDKNKLESSDAGDQSAGGYTWSYRRTANPTTPLVTAGGSFTTAGHGSALGDQGYYVRSFLFSDVTNAKSDQDAFYLEDRWQVTDRVLVTLGARDESFQVYNQSGDKFLKSDNFFSPRLGASWDVSGDSTTKVYGNLGRYSIQTPTHIAVRGAGISSYLWRYYTYTGVDPNGQPLGLTPQTTTFSPDGETGLPKDPKEVAAQNLKPSYQDEAILGVEQVLTPGIIGGVKATYRKLKNTLDDFCDARPFLDYAAAHGIDSSGLAFSCASINPGRTNHFDIDYAGTGTNYTRVNLGPNDFGWSKPKRTYAALDLSLEHPFADNWYGKVVYTFSHSRGNTEGQTRSDVGQTDVSATQTWDFKELMENSYGYLPSDRKHQLKAQGFWQFLSEYGAGADLTIASGRPKNCLGNYGGNSTTFGDAGSDYGSAYFFCTFTGADGAVATPRGSQGRLPWEYTLNMNFMYTPSFVKGLKLRVDIFNVLNRQRAQAIDETHEYDDDPTISSTYGRVISYSAPRAVRLTAQYDF